MRNPNGYGSVVFLGKSRRLPYAVRKTVKFELTDGSCIQKYKYFGYYATKREAILALADLNQRKLDTTYPERTFGEMFGAWIERRSRSLAPSSVKRLQYVYGKYCPGLADKSVLVVTEDEMQAILDGCPHGYQTQATIKLIMQGVMGYTKTQGLRADDPSALLVAGGDKDTRPHKIFAPADVDKMKADPEAWSIFFMLYSGMRIKEILQVKMEDINLEDAYLVGGVKTDAGKGRIIPIHRYLLPLVKARAGQTYLVEYNGKKMYYQLYRDKVWDVVMSRYGLDYTPHDTRHTFITAMSRAGVSDYFIQKIVGHAAKDTTNRVYIHTDPAELLAEINRIS